mmetsp:Transcript_1836/g.2443  ORF Transcript_1836/g.2443 Transcript_1836/m.2443 type:complete len:222 (-) Transcript_1836:446-1111(-)
MSRLPISRIGQDTLQMPCLVQPRKPGATSSSSPSLGPHAGIVDEAGLRQRLGLDGGDLEVALGADRVQSLRRFHGRVSLEVNAVRHVDQREEERMALEEAQLHCSVAGFGHLPDGRDGRPRGGVEVSAIVDLVRDVLGQGLEETGGPSVQHSLVDVGHGLSEQFHARRLIHTSGLGSQDSVLQSLREANSISSGDLVASLQHLERCHLLAVELHTTTALEL